MRRRLQKLILLDKSPKDNIDKQQNQKTIPVAIVVLIKGHIESFPLKTSHYSCKEVHNLDAKLGISEMYTLFMEKYPNCSVKYYIYCNIFREHFDYRFGRPQIDICCECEELQVHIKNPTLNETARRVIEAQLVVHKRRSNKFYASLKQSKEYCKHKDSASCRTSSCLTFQYKGVLFETTGSECFLFTMLSLVKPTFSYTLKV